VGGDESWPLGLSLCVCSVSSLRFFWDWLTSSLSLSLGRLSRLGSARSSVATALSHREIGLFWVPRLRVELLFLRTLFPPRLSLWFSCGFLGLLKCGYGDVPRFLAAFFVVGELVKMCVITKAVIGRPSLCTFFPPPVFFLPSVPIGQGHYLARVSCCRILLTFSPTCVTRLGVIVGFALFCGSRGREASPIVTVFVLGAGVSSFASCCVFLLDNKTQVCWPSAIRSLDVHVPHARPPPGLLVYKFGGECDGVARVFFSWACARGISWGLSALVDAFKCKFPDLSLSSFRFPQWRVSAAGVALVQERAGRAFP